MCFSFKKKIFKSLFFFLYFSLTNIWGKKKSFFFFHLHSFYFLGKPRKKRQQKCWKNIWFSFPCFYIPFSFHLFFPRKKENEGILKAKGLDKRNEKIFLRIFLSFSRAGNVFENSQKKSLKGKDFLFNSLNKSLELVKAASIVEDSPPPLQESIPMHSALACHHRGLCGHYTKFSSD